MLGTAQGVTMLFILTALLCCGEYKGVGKGPGQKAGVKSHGGGGKALAAISFAGLCTGVLTEETGEFFLLQTGTFLPGDPK